MENRQYVVIENTQSSSKTLKILKGEKYFYMHSKYNPQKEAMNYVDSLDIKPDDIIVLVGSGFGYALNEIMKKMTEYNTLIIIETDIQVFKAFKRNFKVGKLVENKLDTIKYELAENARDLAAILGRILDFTLIEKINFNILPSYLNIWPHEMNSYKNSFIAYQGTCRANAASLKVKATSWQKNSFANIKHIFNSYSSSKFFGAFSGKTVIIVSAGPSLDKNIELLKNVQDKAVIICVYTALRALHKRNIKPHFVIAVDESQMLYGDCYDDVPMLYPSTTNSDFISNYKGEKILICSDMTSITNCLFSDYIKDEHKLESGGSVACTAVDLAVKMGANPIVLVGQDLSFTGHSIHVKGGYNDEADIQRFGSQEKGQRFYEQTKSENKEYHEQKYEVTDIFGNTVYTIQFFEIFLSWFENYFEHNKNITKFINATEGGILKRGVEIMSLSDVLSRYCTENAGINDIIERVFRDGKMISDEKRKHSLQNLSDKKESLENALRLVEKAIQYNEKLKALYTSSDNPLKRDLDKVLKVVVEMDDIFEKDTTVSALLGMRYVQIYTSVNARIDPNDNRGVVTAKKNLIFYNGVTEAIKESLDLLEESIKELQQIYN